MCAESTHLIASPCVAFSNKCPPPIQIAELQAGFEKSVDEKDKLTKNMEQTQARLKRAAKLTTGLADEQVRWAESVKVSSQHDNMPEYLKFSPLLATSLPLPPLLPSDLMTR